MHASFSRVGPRLGASALALATVLGTSAIASAQQAPWNAHWEFQNIASGNHQNLYPVETVVFQQFVVLPPATPWLRLFFRRVVLDQGSYLRMSALADGAVQTMHQVHVEQWGYGSAYFNGHVVLLEIVAGANTTSNLVEVGRIWAGDDPATWPTLDSICGPTDDRIPDSHFAIARVDSGCTAWIINLPATGNDKCHLSAGHCFPGSSVIEFLPGLSAANCALVHPGPNQQFAINLGSMRFQNGGIGNDYAVFRCFTNPNTGMTSFQTMGASIPLSAAIPGVGAIARISGYGVDGSDTDGAAGANNNCTCQPGNGTGRRNQIQQTHTGPIVGVANNSISYQVDSCGGNSGSPVFDEAAMGPAMAIHTHGGCANPAGASGNSGTVVTAPALVAAINVVCGSGGGGPITNDPCTTALAVFTGVNGPYSNVGTSTSLPPWPCGAAGSDVWFIHVATCTAPHTFSTCTPARTVDTTLEVFAGDCATLVSLGCSDNTCGTGSSLTVPLTQGQAYRVRVGGAGGAQGSFELVVQPGTGTGSFQTVATGCGALTIAASGSPDLGGTVEFRLDNVQGVPFLRLGLQQINQPICPPSPCLFGPAFEVALFGSTHSLVIPCNPLLIGISAGVQGADLLVPGGCPALQLVVSDTIVLTVG